MVAIKIVNILLNLRPCRPLSLIVKGRLEEAEPLYRRATHIDEKALGEVHRDVARDFSKWAELLQAQVIQLGVAR